MHVDLLRSPLREVARSLVAIALKNSKRRSGVRHLLAEGDTDRLRLDVYPMLASEISEKAAVIVFTPLRAEEPTVLTDGKNGVSATAQSERISTLENEVATTREVLQQTIEELETSNEELQSLNEELITVNEELEMTTSELTERSAELEPMLRSAPLVILVNDTALQITQATQEAINLFGLSSPATGPHISQSVLPHGFPALSHLRSESIRQGEKTVRDFDSNGEHVSLICSPYFNSHGKVSGVTLVVTRFPGLAIEMDTVLKTEGIYVMQRTKGGKAMRISKPFDTFLQSTPKALVGEQLRDCIDEDEADEISSDDREFLTSSVPHANEVRRMDTCNGKHKIWLAKQKFPLWNDRIEDQTIYTIATDVSELVMARNAAQAATQQIEMLQDMAGVGYWSIDIIEGTFTWSNEVHRIHRTDPDTFQPTLELGLNFYHPDDVDEVSQIVDVAIQRGEVFAFKTRIIAVDKTEVHIESLSLAINDPDGQTVRVVGVFREI